MATLDCPLVHYHAVHQSSSSMSSTVHLLITYIRSKKFQLERRCGFCVQECSLSIKSALSFTTVAFRQISSTSALMKLLLPIQIHAVVFQLQATHRPTIAGLLFAPIAPRVSLFFLLCIWRCRLFGGCFVPLMSLCMESTSYVLSFRMVSFYVVTTGCFFHTNLCLFNQSIKNPTELHHSSITAT